MKQRLRPAGPVEPGPGPRSGPGPRVEKRCLTGSSSFFHRENFKLKQSFLVFSASVGVFVAVGHLNSSPPPPSQGGPDQDALGDGDGVGGHTLLLTGS